MYERWNRHKSTEHQIKCLHIIFMQCTLRLLYIYIVIARKRQYLNIPYCVRSMQYISYRINLITEILTYILWYIYLDFKDYLKHAFYNSCVITTWKSINGKNRTHYIHWKILRSSLYAADQKCNGLQKHVFINYTARKNGCFSFLLEIPTWLKLVSIFDYQYWFLYKIFFFTIHYRYF